MVDVVYSGATQYQTFFSLGRYPGGDGQFGQAVFTTQGRAPSASISHDPVTWCTPYSGGPVRLGDSDVKFADMNGDGLVDLVRIREGDTRYWPGRANGFWGTGTPVDCPAGQTFVEDRSISMGPLPMPPSFDDSLLLMSDVNGDGLDDLVQIRFDAVDVWLNKYGQSWATRHVVPGQPTSSIVNRVRLTDVNGSGTRDILWGDAGDYRYIDLQGGVRPWLLVSASNGLGKTTDIQYSTSIAMMLAAEKTGQPWESVAPMTYQVVQQVTQDDHLDVVGRPRGRYVSQYAYRDPVYDGAQREFRGFRQGTTTHPGDTNSPTDIAETTFRLGECENDPGDPIDRCTPQGRAFDNPREALKGIPIVTDTYDQAGRTLSTAHNTLRLRTLYLGLDGRTVRETFADRSDTYKYDVNGTFAPHTGSPAGTSTVPDLEVETVVGGAITTESLAVPLWASTGVAHTEKEASLDAFGNTQWSVDHGCIEGCGPDETLTTVTTMARPTGDASGWIFRLTDTYVVGADPTTRWHHILSTYDPNGFLLRTDEELTGTLALARRHETGAQTAGPPPNAAQDGIITMVSYTNDAFGNPTMTKGANARCRSLSYDGDYALLPTVETLYVGSQSGECGGTQLQTTTAYDLGLQLPTQMLGWHGEVARVEYDGLGRPVRFFRPSSDPALLGVVPSLPSVTVDYFPTTNPTGQPWSSVRTRTQDSAEGSPSTRDLWVISDGMGRTISRFAQADVVADGSAWVVSGVQEYDAKGAVARMREPFFTNVQPDLNPLSAQAATSYRALRYDAFGRAIQRFATDGTLVQQDVFHAMSTDQWDAEDLALGPHQGSYSTTVMDGHGRHVLLVERMHQGGSLQAFQTSTSYTPTGEVSVVTRTPGPAGAPVVRWVRRDSQGHVVLNVEPDATTGFSPDPSTPPDSLSAWRYAYNYGGQLVGTSDARGCGENIYYDAGGRQIAEDFSPCRADQLGYTPPALDAAGMPTGDGTEAFVRWDVPDPDTAAAEQAGLPPTGVPLLGRVTATADRGQKTITAFDGRGRAIGVARRVAAAGDPGTSLDARYAAGWFVRTATYDAMDRSLSESTGATSSALQGSDGKSVLTATYTKRGLTGSIGGSYGPIFASSQVNALGQVVTATYGDLAGTTTSYAYDQRDRLRSVQTTRGPPGQWSTSSSTYPKLLPGDPDTQIALLQDIDIAYDGVSNPVEIRDWRSPDDWPSYAKPVTRKIQYDDGYRVTRVDYEYNGGNAWLSPYAAEDSGNVSAQGAAPSPHVALDGRPLYQTYEYDSVGNLVQTGDDETAFFDRSLGTVTLGAGRPYQMASASNLNTPSTRAGGLNAAYDDAGNMTALGVQRAGQCLPGGASCWQRFQYTWDEIGRLQEARRWDLQPGGERTSGMNVTSPPPTRTPDVDLGYAYDSSDNRVIKSAVSPNGSPTYTLYVFDSLELRGTVWTDSNDYARDFTTEVPRLVIAGARFGRVVYGQPDMPSLSGGQQHVFLELTDNLGSNNLVIDRDSSELIEATQYQPYGATESDYRPDRWKNYRTDYRYTGKEEDIEVGLNYFGKRYYSPYLGRWISPDPKALHSMSGDLNLYAYVSGHTFSVTDPNGEFFFLIPILIAAAVSAGVSIGTQMAASGSFDFGVVNWGEVALAAGIGAVSGGAGAVAGAAASSVLGGVMSDGAAMLVGDVIVGGGVGGMVGGGLNRYAHGQGLGSATDFMLDAGEGMLFAAAMTGAVAGGKAIFRGLATDATAAGAGAGSSLAPGGAGAGEGGAAGATGNAGTAAGEAVGDQAGLTLELRPKVTWDDGQMADFNMKVEQLQKMAEQGELIVTDVERDPSVTRAFREEAGAAAEGKDVDHVKDLRLNGADADHNLQLLDRSVNRSVGAQVGNQLRGVPEGTKIDAVKVLPPKKAPIVTAPPPSPRMRVAPPEPTRWVIPETGHPENGVPIEPEALKAMVEGGFFKP